jgi:hypothetical protein
MRLLLVAALALIPGSAGAVATPSPATAKKALPPASADCPRTTSYYAYRDGEKLKPQKLGQLPPANAYAAVFRHIGRCEVPIVVKYGVGGR